jgi:two-component system KDP operon response regulator KdpE
MKTARILIVDCNPTVVKELKAQIVSLGMEPLWAAGGREAIQFFVYDMPDAVILHGAFPDLSGWQTAELIRAISDAPIIFITDRPDRLDRNRALQLGDDYMSPPWRWDRLRARLPALLKRSTGQPTAMPDPYDDGYLKVDIGSQAVTRNGAQVELTHTELKMLSCFVRYPNRALSHGEILQSVWGHRYLKAKADVTLYVWHLRQKLEADPQRPTYFRTVRGIGYLFALRAGASGGSLLTIANPHYKLTNS